jgi:glycine/D-amino acid oxidase-like deaminating enzyme/nitrite reductase/ring-hydroxylating ferredoxin subunit
LFSPQMELVMKNVWQTTTENRKSYPTLNQELEADVCIVGGGITGMTAAIELAKSGKKVIVLEAEKLAFGTTGSSSNHLSTQIDFSYRNVEKNFNGDIARIVASSRAEAIDRIEKNILDYKLNCDFKRIDGFLYTENEDNLETLENEYDASLRSGLQVSKTHDAPLPFPVKLAVRYANQGAFNAIKYVTGLGRQVELYNGSIYENSRVLEFDKNTMTVRTSKGSVKASHVFLATHLPLFINLHQTTSAPYRSYMIALKVQNLPGDALYWDMFDPYHYTRIYEQNGEKWLAIGGADHKTGQNDPEKDYFNNLEVYARRRYMVSEITHRWSHQYYEPSDGLPYIGLSPFDSTYMATGFSGDGLVYGTVAGILVSDMIMGKDNEWSRAYDSKRFKPLASASSFLKHNVDVAKHLIADRFTSDDLKNLKANNGVVIRKDGDNYAVYKNNEGLLTVCSAVCTHMGCIVSWNHIEKTWDCGCHGSQFAHDGKILIGPATNNLQKVGDEKPQKLKAEDTGARDINRRQ